MCTPRLNRNCVKPSRVAFIDAEDSHLDKFSRPTWTKIPQQIRIDVIYRSDLSIVPPKEKDETFERNNESVPSDISLKSCLIAINCDFIWRYRRINCNKHYDFVKYRTASNKTCDLLCLLNDEFQAVSSSSERYALQLKKIIK